MKGRLGVVVLITVGAAGAACTRSEAGSGASAGASQTSGGGSSSGGAGTSSGGTTRGSGTGSASATGGNSGTTGASGTTGSPLVDGGYVFCSLASTADAGPIVWMCHPGTYFCDPSDGIGSCLQCRSDADCTNQDLPTYDPLRPRCDLDSGVTGYQEFCQGCLADSDCVANPAGAFCDLNPVYPPNGLEPPVEALGFESCGQIQTDCRLTGGPRCQTLNQICDPLNGHCVDRSTRCSADQDCVGVLVPAPPNAKFGSPYLLQAYCVNGACNACAGGVCPNNNACFSDADCGNPTSSPAGLRCEPYEHSDGGSLCACTDSSQCGGFWPVCLPSSIFIDDAGQSIGVCSCDSDDQCGDGGLACLPPLEPNPFPSDSGFGDPLWIGPLPTINGAQGGSSFCGLPCTSVAFPSCSALAAVDICNPTTRVCDWCLNDEQCVSNLGSGGPTCDGPLNMLPPPRGNCGCVRDADCLAGESCLSGLSRSPFLGTCVPTLSRCTPEACGGYFCNWDSGACVDASDFESFPSCVNDADCNGEVCLEGSCVRCRDPSRCPQPVQSVYDQPCLGSGDCDGGLGCTDNICQPCSQPSDCAAGSLCLFDGLCHAVCASGVCPPGEVCDGRNSAGNGANVCYQCLSPLDCPNGEGCDGDSHTCGTCRGPTARGGPYECPPDSVCSNYWLGPSGACLPSCDRESCPSDRPICAVLPSLTPDHKYCFGCLQDADCGDGGAWCDESFSRSFTCQPPGS